MSTTSWGLSTSSSIKLVALQRLLDPLVIVGLLLGLGYFYQVPLNKDYWFLATTTYLLSFPIFRLAGRYRLECEQGWTWELPRILVGWGVVLSLLLFLGYTTKSSSEFSRSLLLTWAVSAPLVICVLHQLIQYCIAMQSKSGRSGRTAVIVGSGDIGQHLADQLRHVQHSGVQLLGFFDNFGAADVPTKHDLLGKLDKLADYVRLRRVDIVFITAPISDERLEDLIQGLQDTTACVYFVPNILMFNLMRARTHQINGIPLIAIWESPLYDLQSDVKRLIDIAIAGIVLMLIFPLLVVISIAVKLSSPGPIIFKQRRYGLHGQEIVIYKFRSMTVMEDGVHVAQAKRNDDRVTKVGAFLRKTSLDELPQFINVLQGRMSVVGPRPHAISHNETYRKIINGYMLRHKMKPGITGWAQVHGFRGETDTLDKMRRRVEYDLEYFKNWSLALDLQIIFRTALIFFHSPNAY
jgi:putative colanic acid biosysnthesis UDP-glucose lipid carrier transferase